MNRRLLLMLLLALPGCAWLGQQTPRGDASAERSIAAEFQQFDAGADRPGFLERGRPEPGSMLSARLERMVSIAADNQTDALLVIHDNRVLVERYFNGPPRRLPLMSVTKGVSSLAIGMLRDEGKIRSLDMPMSTWFPAWKNDPRKARVTLRHVMTHTSGVGETMMGREIYHHSDWVAAASRLPAITEPGTEWAYNNAMCQLLSEVVRQSAGEPIDRYFYRRLFQPLGITDWSWNRDRHGNLDTFGGLRMFPRDLAKIGLMMMQDGKWKGKQLLSGAYLQEATSPVSPRFAQQGLIWRVSYPDAYTVQTPASLEVLRKRGHAAIADTLAPLSGRPYFNREREYLRAISGVLDEPSLKVLDALEAGGVSWVEVHGQERRVFSHGGWLGQYLVVDPTHRLVAVRMRNVPDQEADMHNWAYQFGTFESDVERLLAPAE